ncbi:unnamed protein product [Parnassius apollo]|uniref:(apollo) hypothetical protein n=1 Tax=Parnassius apollo TaxID=110799 RepID=A0A8S3XBE8_PARAO|nr:unnamed protein product [Parnassius apollo]
MVIPESHEARDDIQFTTINHVDIWPVECDIENDCNDNIFSLESVKAEEENFEYENSKLEVNGNHEKDTAEQQEDLEIDALEDRNEDSEDDLPLISLGAKSKTDHLYIEQPRIQTNNFSKPSNNETTLQRRQTRVNRRKMVQIVEMEELEFVHRFRKGYHSLNVQIVCNSNLKITNVNPKFGGATHDSFIWASSRMETFMRELHQNGEQVWLLGDSGYPDMFH